MRLAILLMFASVSCGRAAETGATAPSSESETASPPARSVEVQRPADAERVDAATECWRLRGDPGGRLCRRIERRDPVEGRSSTEIGVFELARPGEATRRLAYQRVFRDGAAGSVYLTFFDAAGEPVVVLRRCQVCEEPRMMEVRIERDPQLRAELEPIDE